MVVLDGDKMYWERIEEGQQVTVALRKTVEKPLAPWDQIVGFWNIKEPDRLPGAPRGIFIRWDRVYVLTSETSRDRGVWHIHGHRPLLRLLSDEGDEQDQTWLLEFPNPGRMIWLSEDGNHTVELEQQRN